MPNNKDNHEELTVIRVTNRESVGRLPAMIAVSSLMALSVGCDGVAESQELNAATEKSLDAAISGAHRSDDNKARDRYRRL